MVGSPPVSPPVGNQLGPRLIKIVIPVFYLFILVAGLIGCIRLASYLNQPFAGYVTMWRKEIKMYVVSYQTPPTWPGIRSGMMVNDRILCIDGYRPYQEAGLYALDAIDAAVICPRGALDFIDLFDRAYHERQPTLDFIVDRGGEILEAPNVPVQLFNIRQLLDLILPSFLAGLGLLLVGWVVYRAAPGDPTNGAFAIFVGIAACIAFNQGYLGEFGNFFRSTRLVTLAMVIPWAPFIGPVAFDLVNRITDPSESRRLVRRVKPIFYALALLVSLVGIYTYLDGNSRISVPLTWFYLGIFALSAAFAAIWSIVDFTWAYRKSPSRRTRRQSGLILLGLAIMVLASIPFLAYTFFNQSTTSYTAYLPYLGLGVLAVVAYAILRYQLFEAKSRILIYLILLIVCILAAILVSLLFQIEEAFVPVLAASLLVGFIFEGKWGYFLDPLLHREKKDYQVIARLSSQVGDLRQAERMLPNALSVLLDEFDASQVDLWVWGPGDQQAEHFSTQSEQQETAGRLVASHIASSDGASLRNRCTRSMVILPPGMSEALSDHPAPIYRGTQNPACQELSWPGLPADPGAICAPLVDQNHVVGVMRLGSRWTGEVYEQGDLRLAGILAQVLALAVANRGQYQRLQTMQDMLLQAEDHERRKVARELHDTILQFLHLMTYGLDEIKVAAPNTSAMISLWQERISDEANQMRDLLAYLRTPEILVERGLAPSLLSWIAHISKDADIQIHTELSAEIDDELGLLEKASLFRVFREAIHNSLRHSGASQIDIWLQRRSGRIEFGISDNGQGFDPNDGYKTTLKGYSSLADMQVYVASMGGQLEIRSGIGHGTQIEGWVRSVK